MARLSNPFRLPSRPRRQRGAVAIMLAGALLLLIFCAALAIDAMNLFVVRNQLQNGADASSLAGAGYLWTGTPMPNLVLAEQKGEAAIPLNKSEGKALSSGVVEAGYWSLADGFSAGAMANPGTTHIPAVRVRIVREGSGELMSNGGGVRTYFARVFGLDHVTVGATSIAVVAPPGMVYPGSLFPMALTQCLFDNFWDSTTGKPKNDPVTGLPYVFRIGSAYHYGPCSSGQWTSFLLDQNNTPVIRNLVDNGNEQTIEIGDSTWMEPGTKNTLFDYVNNCSAADNKKCEYVTVPIITSNDVDTHARQPVGAFACVRVLNAVGGSAKYVTVQMSSGCKVEGGGNGHYYGSTLPPKLSQ